MRNKPFRPMLLERLKDSQFAVDYLTEVLQNESQEAFLIALRHVIDARQENISELADEVGITRQGLYKTLSEDGNPRLSTLSQILKSLGMTIKISGDLAA